MSEADGTALFDLPPVPAEAALRPIIKFPGGKSFLVPFVRSGIRLRLAAHPGARYIEPFAGGIAVGLYIGWPDTIACDLSPDLIDLYRAARRAPQAVAAASVEVCARYAGQDDAKTPHDGYYGARRAYNARAGGESSHRAALLLYMNRRGYNGLCRVNGRGKWNVPQGKDSAGNWRPAPEPVDPERLTAFARATAGWTWRCADFAEALAEARAGDVAYCDPPYADPDKEERASKMFVGYTAGGFSARDQVRLADALAAARDRGVAVIHTNVDSETIRVLYRDRRFWLLPTAELRAVNRNGEGRARKPCLLALSHPEMLYVPEEEQAAARAPLRSGAGARQGVLRL